MMMLGGEAGEVKPGFLADLLVVAGEPQDDVRVLQKQDNLKIILKDGRVHRNVLAHAV